MPVKIWPREFEKKEHINTAERFLLRNAMRNLKEGCFAIGIDPVGFATDKVHMGMYINQSEGLITFSIVQGSLDPASVMGYLAMEKVIEPAIYERLLNSRLLIARSGDKKILKFPYKHIFIFPDEEIPVTSCDADTLLSFAPYSAVRFFIPATAKNRPKFLKDLRIFDDVRMPYDSNFTRLSDEKCLAIFERLAPEYTVVLKKKDEVEVVETTDELPAESEEINGNEVEYIACGKTHLETLINERLNLIADQIASEIRIVPDADLFFRDLVDKDRFELKCVAKPDTVNAHWSVDVYQMISEEDGDYYFTYQMVNKTAKPDRQNLGYLPKIYDAGMTVVADEGIRFKEIPMRYFKTGFKKKDPVFAVAENASVEFDEKDNALRTVNIPRYYQKRTITIDKYSAYTKFNALIEDPVKNLKYILSELKKDYQNCHDEFDNAEGLTDTARDNFRAALSDYETEIARFEDGIHQIEYTDWVKKAFVLMNKTFQTKLDSNTHPIEGWRLFQIVFIVSMICEVIRGEYKDDPDPALKKADNDIANLLYFPTGGGKTEAFLGITVFSMFFDRVRGKDEGVTAILKYPLRLLAVQQLERVLTVVMKANIVRKQDAQLQNTNAFSLGFYVGQANTPKRGERIL